MAAVEFQWSSNGDLTYASRSTAAEFAGATSPIVRQRPWPDEERDRMTSEAFETRYGCSPAPDAGDLAKAIGSLLHDLEHLRTNAEMS